MVILSYWDNSSIKTYTLICNCGCKANIAQHYAMVIAKNYLTIVRNHKTVLPHVQLYTTDQHTNDYVP